MVPTNDNREDPRRRRSGHGLADDADHVRRDRRGRPRPRCHSRIGILEAGFADVGRELEPDNERLFTWWAPLRTLRQRNIGWRIDYVLASAGLFERVQECRVLSDVGTSDHAPVVAVFDGVS
jgi:exonuclease III